MRSSKFDPRRQLRSVTLNKKIVGNPMMAAFQIELLHADKRREPFRAERYDIHTPDLAANPARSNTNCHRDRRQLASPRLEREQSSLKCECVAALSFNSTAAALGIPPQRTSVRTTNLANIAAYVVARIALTELSGRASGEFQTKPMMSGGAGETRPIRFRHFDLAGLGSLGCSPDVAERRKRSSARS